MQRQRIEAIWRECREKYGSGGPFLFGHFTAADAMYAPVVTRFDTYGGELAPDTRAYVDAVLGDARDARMVCRRGSRDMAGAGSRRVTFPNTDPALNERKGC